MPDKPFREGANRSAGRSARWRTSSAGWSRGWSRGWGDDGARREPGQPATGPRRGCRRRGWTATAAT